MSKRKKYNYFDDTEYVEPNNQNLKANENAIKAFAQNSVSTVVQAITDLDDKSQENKKKRRIAAIVLIMFTIIMIIAIVLTETVVMHKVNTKEADFSTAAGKVCATMQSEYGLCNYENLTTQYDIDGYRMTGLCYARQIDFNNDDKDELLVCYNTSGEYYVEVYALSKGSSLSQIYKAELPQTKKMNCWVTLYSHKNKYYIAEHNKDDISKVTLYQLKGNKFVEKYSAKFDTDSKEFTIKGKDETDNFERVKMAVLSGRDAGKMADDVTATVDDFDTDDAEISDTNSQSLKDAYYQIIENYNDKYGYAEYVEKDNLAYLNGLAVVDLVDFDNDGTNEMVLIYRRGIKTRGEDKDGNYLAKTKYVYYCEIYAYNGTSAVQVYQSEGISNSLDSSKDAYYILKHKNGKTYWCTNSFEKSNLGKIVSASSSILKFKNNTFKSELKASYETDYGYTEYYINGREVYRSTFASKGYQVPFFDGSTNYDSNQFDVIYLQRKSSKAGNMKNQVTLTENSIKQLNDDYKPGE